MFGAAKSNRDDPYRAARASMVREQIAGRGIRDPRVVAAMSAVPREVFVPDDLRSRAYDDGALPLPHGQAISQPYVVAAMTEALALPPGTPYVLEVGTGSGYQAAVLLAMGACVLTVERIPALAREAAKRLAACPGLDPAGVVARGPAPQALRSLTGDGIAVAGEHGPFDGIVVTAAADRVPDALVRALRTGARLVIPVGLGAAALHVLTRTPSGVEDRILFDVRFVPLLPGVAPGEGSGGLEAMG